MEWLVTTPLQKGHFLLRGGGLLVEGSVDTILLCLGGALPPLWPAPMAKGVAQRIVQVEWHLALPHFLVLVS